MKLQLEKLVQKYHGDLYRFALSMAKNDADAWDLTQQTYYRFLTKGHTIYNPNRVKSWLFTTLYREFLEMKRRPNKYPTQELSSVESEIPSVDPEVLDRVDAGIAVKSLHAIAEIYRAPLTLFYLEQHTYKEISEILEVPIGTVMSRLSRGKVLLKNQLMEQV